MSSGGPPVGSHGGSRAFASKLSRAPAMDIRRQTAHELQTGTNVLDGRPSSGSQHNRLSAINQRIGHTSVTSVGAGSLAALAASNDISVGSSANASSVRTSNAHSVSFMQRGHPSASSGTFITGGNAASGNVIITVPSGPSSLVGNGTDTGILDISGGVIEPLDYEEYVQQQQRAYGNTAGRVSSAGNVRGQLCEGGITADERLHLVDFPADDIEVNVVPRKIRTVQHVVPDEQLEKLEAAVQNCVECYTSDWVVVRRRYQNFSSSVRRQDQLEERLSREASLAIHQEFEVDDEVDATEGFIAGNRFSANEFETVKNGKHLPTRSTSTLDIKKERSWRKSMNQGSYDTISIPNARSAGSRKSLASLQSLDDMVTSGALYRRRFSGMGETRSMTGGFDEIVYNNIKREEEDVRSLHFSYSVTSESQPPSRKSSFRIRRANGDKSETDSRSVISDGDITPTNQSPERSPSIASGEVNHGSDDSFVMHSDEEQDFQKKQQEQLQKMLAAMAMPEVLRNREKEEEKRKSGEKRRREAESKSKREKEHLIKRQMSEKATHGEKDTGGSSQRPTPRGSWASFDLRNQQADPLIPKLLDPVQDAATVDGANELQRTADRSAHLFSLYPCQGEDEAVERRRLANEPVESMTHRILVHCSKLELNLKIEPIFACMALYDVREKRKVSENFYFDLNPEDTRKMLEGHNEKADYSTQARSCIFEISRSVSSHSNSCDLFLVVKLEKVLQGDINESAEPYIKDVNIEKAKWSAIDACTRLGAYRMPFAWTAIWLQNIIKSKDTAGGQDSGGSDVEAGGNANSLDRKHTSTASFDQYRRKHAAIVASTSSSGDSSSLTRRGSLDRKDKRSSWAASSITGGSVTGDAFGEKAHDTGVGGHSLSVNSSSSMFDSFPPVTLTVSSFFKQEPDKLNDEHLYRFLQDLKKPSPVLKRLKIIKGTLKLDISVAPEQVKNCYTSELAQLNPFPNKDVKRPSKEIMEFSSFNTVAASPYTLLPYYQFRNLIYICPKSLNFTNRGGERARNIAVKIQFMSDEGMKGMKVIYGKSHCAEFTTEVYTAVTYHNKNPDFYEEVKVALPSNVKNHHHVLFTFYHISCQGQRKDHATSAEIPVGYTWIPIFRDGSLQTGTFELPITTDPPSSEATQHSTDSISSAITGLKWVDGKKNIFYVDIIPATTVHALDRHLDMFLSLTAKLQLGQNSSESETTNGTCKNYRDNSTEDSLLKTIDDLHKARIEPLVRFLPLVLDKLLLLMVRPPIFDSGRLLNIGQSAFNAMASIVNRLTSEVPSRSDRHGRNELLTTYINYQAHLPHPDLRSPDGCVKPASANRYDEVDGNMQSNREGFSSTAGNGASNFARLVHEQLIFLYLQGGPARDSALKASWFFLELTIKAMIEHLATTARLGVQRKHRFSEQFHEDTTNLVSAITSDVIGKRKSDHQLVESVNSSLAFFLHDLLSVMDRGFVFSLIRTYMKDIATKMLQAGSVNNDSVQLWNLQINFSRILCSHEHFVALNLPSWHPQNNFISEGGNFYSGSSSPTPSVKSTDSQSSFVSHGLSQLDGGHSSGKSHWAELTPEFRRKHYLVGLVLSHLSNAFNQVNAEVHYKAVNAIRNLMTSHDIDARFSGSINRPNTEQNGQKKISMVANLYLPLIAICLENLPKLHAWTSDGESRIVGKNQDEHLNSVLNKISDNMPNPKAPIMLKEKTTRNLLICVLWVLKNVEKSVLKQWWTELPTHRLLTLLEILRITLSCFQYKGKRGNRRGCYDRIGITKTDSKWTSKFEGLERMIMGPSNSAGANERPSQRRDISNASRTNSVAGLPPSPNPSDGCTTVGQNRKWHKTSLGGMIRNASSISEKADSISLSGVSTDLAMRNLGDGSTGGAMIPSGISEYSPEMNAHLEGCLATEASMVVLDTLELIVQVVSHTDHSQGLLTSVLKVLLHGLGTNQSTFFIRHLFAVQRSFVFKFPSLLFDEASEHCADLCLRLLKHCSSSISAVRSQSSASLYLLMRQNFEIGNNFARVKMQVTMSLSSLVGTVANFNEDYLRKSLKTILVYAEKDNELSETTFTDQVQDLVLNLSMILSDTVKMKEYEDDQEMKMDLMYRIAKGYQNNPDLRLTWLESMAKNNEDHDHHAEAAMCKVHCAALISEYLHMLEDRKYMPTGAVSYEHITPNASEESAVSDDVVTPDAEGICMGSFFTEGGLIQFVDDAARLFNKAGLFETVNEVYKPVIPIAEANRNFTKLADVHNELHVAFQKVDRLQGKRIFGTYYRVAFYGSRFGDLDGEEYIYKEKPLAKLVEIAHRIENFYCEKFGKDNLILIKDSKGVNASDLLPEKAYIQITYVEPYFDSYDLKERITAFERNFNISRFIFSTPFTPNGTPHGELHEQFKRKTILTTETHFPYVKTRIKVVDRKEMVLTPIEVAIEDVQKKIDELDAVVKQDPPDRTILQMVLQGCIGTTVNQGPVEVANVFLKDIFEGKKVPTKHQNKLRLCFKEFSNKAEEALKKNKKLIDSDQKEYQAVLQENYNTFKDKLSPLFTLNHPGRGGTGAINGSKTSSSPIRSNENSKVTSPMI